jgi:hypothetical protein
MLVLLSCNVPSLNNCDDMPKRRRWCAMAGYRHRHTHGNDDFFLSLMLFGQNSRRKERLVSSLRLSEKGVLSETHKSTTSKSFGKRNDRRICIYYCRQQQQSISTTIARTFMDYSLLPLTPVSLERSSPGQSWGFRLQGGIDYRVPLSIKKVRILSRSLSTTIADDHLSRS